MTLRPETKAAMRAAHSAVKRLIKCSDSPPGEGRAARRAAEAAQRMRDCLQADVIAHLRAKEDRLLGLKEVARRLGYSERALRFGVRQACYPFVFRNRGRLVGSQEGLERWLKAPTAWGSDESFKILDEERWIRLTSCRRTN